MFCDSDHREAQLDILDSGQARELKFLQSGIEPPQTLNPTFARPSNVTLAMASPLRLGLLQDIAELQTKPYPNVVLHIHDDNITTACLILTVESYGAMHLTINFGEDYPLTPPKIRMDSKVTHPNIKEASHICASILDTDRFESHASQY
jgi:hypothetical protein